MQFLQSEVLTRIFAQSTIMTEIKLKCTASATPDCTHPKQGMYKSSATNFQEISRTHLTKFQQDLYIIEPLKHHNIGYKHMHFQLCMTLWIKLHKILLVK